MARGLDIAVDGGGSRLRAYLVEDGEVVQALSRPIGVNPNVVGLDACVEAVADIVLELAEPLRRRGRDQLDGVERIACGLAGVGLAMTRLAVHVGLKARLGNRVSVISDAEALLIAARPEGAAVVLIAGTGSIALARALDGTIHRAGGRLPAGGDPGGGAWLGERAAARLPALVELAAEDRGPELDRLAKMGDWVARGLFEEAAAALAELLAEVRDAAGLETAPLIIHGGLIAHSPVLRSALRRRLEARDLGLIPVRSRFDPRLGPLIALRPASESSWSEPSDAPIL